MSALLPNLVDEIVKLNPLQRAFVSRAIAELRSEEVALLEQYLSYVTSTGVEPSFLAESYDLIVKDMLTEQMFFRRHKRYRYSRYDEVAAHVYQNEGYMTKYMHGLALTSFLWPNHARMRRYFEATLPRDRSGPYLEVGPGHGLYFMTAMRYTQFSTFTAVDISPTSVALTTQILTSGAFGQFSKFSIELRDFLHGDLTEIACALVMGEVLEHVEDPIRFLRRAREATSPDAFIFVTTCINSPAFDHIFLFESMKHLASIVEAAQLRISDSLVLPYEGLSLEETNASKLPVNVAMVLCR